MEFLFLGTGTSAGVPVVGCKCRVCASGEERLRSAGLLKVGGKSLLIDIGPDFRLQALRAGIDHLDGLMLTHTHFDHIAGLDEIRVFKRALPCLLSEASYKEIQRRYDYMFQPEKATAKFDFQIGDGEVDFCGVKVRCFHYWQTGMQVTGFRVGNFAYVNDLKTFDETIFESLEGVETLVVSALQPEKSTFHLSFAEAVAFARRAGAKKTWITHLGHFYLHEELNQRLPDDIRVAYDGLQLCMK